LRRGIAVPERRNIFWCFFFIRTGCAAFVPLPPWLYVGMNTKTRLDQHLVSLGLAVSRQQAQQLIRAGRVRDPAGTLLDKPGQPVAAGLIPRVELPPRFVSRGGEKLVAALEVFPIVVADRICLDGGISTGGFTDCLLQGGARRVYGIDVGYGQTAWSLRTDARLVLRERTNLRHLQPADLYGPEDPWPDLAVADLSFISLVLVLPALGALLAPGAAEAVLLVKPQFEVGRQRVGKGGVVRDPEAHVDAITAVLTAAEGLGWHGQGVVASPITGPAGNHEYLLWLQRAPFGEAVPRESVPREEVPREAVPGGSAAVDAPGACPEPETQRMHGVSKAGARDRAEGLRRSELEALVRTTLA
jgi:23S rRNA (cytidine1920-2'-O)/16S rRNA (cytidine1409-2'-O)-methyltransferase